MSAAPDRDPRPGAGPEGSDGPARASDGTRELLLAGGATLAAGLLSVLLIFSAYGGIGPQGPHTNAAWLLLILALMCLPFGLMLFGLGLAKWLRNRRLRGGVEARGGNGRPGSAPGSFP